MRIKEITRKLRLCGVCDEAVAWLKGSDYKTSQEAWDNCERGDWMLWIIGKTCGKDRRKLVLAACKCARLSLKYVPKDEKRPLKAITTAENWADGNTTVEDITNAANAAAAAANDAYANVAYAANAAYYAANAAYYVANAASADANAAYYAANAAYAAYAAANANANAAARKKILHKCAMIVRSFYPNPPRLRRK